MLEGQWNEGLKSFAAPHLLQSLQWAQLKEAFGWRSHFKSWQKDGQICAMALVLSREFTLPRPLPKLKMLYVPLGPLFKNIDDIELQEQVLLDLRRFAEQENAFLLKIEPEIKVALGEPGSDDEELFQHGEWFSNTLKVQGWHYSTEQIQFKNTVMIDLQPDEDSLLANMKQKTRYNVRLAQRKGVIVRQGTPADFEELYQMYGETALRDNFTIRERDYYLKLWSIFYQAGMLTPLMAEISGETIAGLMLFHFDSRAWYLYGMSRAIHRNLMPTYLLQWEAIRVAKNLGCTSYDLWGAPAQFNEQDSMWGVYRFKSGLGGKVVRHIGAWDLPINTFWYKVYSQVLPKVLAIMRKRGNKQTLQDSLS